MINLMPDDSMVDTEINMSIEIPEGEDRYASSYRRYKKRDQNSKFQSLINLLYKITIHHHLLEYQLNYAFPKPLPVILLI